MSITRRSHYIPQFYLNNFTIDNLIYECDKSTKSIEQKSSRGVGWKPYFNIFIDYLLKRNEGLEKFLNFCEDEAPRSLQKIIIDDNLSDSEMVDFMIFMSMIKFRVPRFKEYVIRKYVNKEKKDFFQEFKSTKAREEFIEEYNKKTGKETGLTVENFFKKVYVSDKAFEDGIYFFYMIKSGFGNVKEFIKKDWYFIETDGDNFFITSDDPLVTLPARTYQLRVLEILEIESTKNLYIFPISKNLILFLFANKSNKEPVNKGRFNLNNEADYIVEINKIIFQESYNFIYSPVRETISYL